MVKFNLVLADTDEGYIDSLGKFARSTCASRFNVNVFTQKPSLLQFLHDHKKQVDILLMSPDFICDELLQYPVGITLILSDGRISESMHGLPLINKYQPGEKILGKIIDLYSDENANAECLVKGDKKTQVVSVFSPQAGSGKTILSVYLAHQFSKHGFKTLYLNLESINSTAFFLSLPENEYGLSNVLYHLKENSKNLKVRLDAARCMDNVLDISSFRPLDCSLEMDDITDVEINKLIYELREMAQFDLVIVDTDSTLNRRNMAVFNSSDCVLSVVLQDVMAKFKLDSFYSEVRKTMPEDGKEFFQKLTLVMNKYIAGSFMKDIFITGSPIGHKIPFVNDIYSLNNGTYVFNPKSSINNYIKKLAIDLIGKFEMDSAAR